MNHTIFMLLIGVIRAVDSSTKRKMMAGGLAASMLAVSLVVSLGFFGGIFDSPLNPGPYTPSSGDIITITETISTAFADYIPYDEEFTVNAPAYSIAPDLANVINLNSFPELTTEQKVMIEQNGFVVIPQDSFDQIYEILKDTEDDGDPIFITSDAVLHAFHVCYDLALRQAEVYSFWSLLGNLTISLLEDSYSQYLDAPEGDWKDAALRNVAYFTVAAYLIDNTTPIRTEVASMVNPVLQMIEDHSDVTDDWFMGYREDFTQFVPRGHYTRSETLSKFFQVMMWYGRTQFRLNEPIGLQHTPQAILIAMLLNNPVSGLGVSMNGYEVWDAIYQPTVFFVGAADDLLPTEYNQLISQIYGVFPTWTALQEDGRLTQFISAANELREPLILGSPVADTDDINVTKGLRLMGQRFIPDSYILSQLVYTNVGTQLNPRLMPKGLDVMAAFGSDRAWKLLDDQKHYENYVEQMTMLQDMIGNQTNDDWTQNLYYLWLYSLLPLLTEPGEGYPIFMQNQAWVDKQLNTALGSWAELRHDTLLYAKQSYTGELTSIPPPAAGYVEPVPRVYSRLASLSNMMISGLESRELLTDNMELRLDTLSNFLLTLKAISEKQLSGIALNATEEDFFRSADTTLQFIAEMPDDDLITSDTDQFMSVIADVHTDTNTMTVLEEAVGDPMIIIVAVYVNGFVQLARGGTFSYYEFAHPIDDRLTDEGWREMLDQGLAPGYPSWTESFIVPNSSESLFSMAEAPRKVE
ncbi:MAG: DUF3160 domain-containing protein [Candidatus Thorarchaeota archaeon]|nr:DUF3160 domain-containing protein [Candidatus Thorarchaeota archaeon]